MQGNVTAISELSTRISATDKRVDGIEAKVDKLEKTWDRIKTALWVIAIMIPLSGGGTVSLTRLIEILKNVKP